LRKHLKKEVEFIFINAPHVIPEDDNLHRPPHEQERGWFFSRPELAYRGIDKTDICIGLQETISFLVDKFKEEGPFDGILGFSQGACLLSLLSVHFKPIHPDLKYQFAIFFSGFKSQLTPHSVMYQATSSIASFHSIGGCDAVIPPEMSKELTASFINPTIYEHNGGHYIPASPELRRTLQDFLRPFLCSGSEQ
jgi:predicted esterase